MRRGDRLGPAVEPLRRPRRRRPTGASNVEPSSRVMNASATVGRRCVVDRRRRRQLEAAGGVAHDGVDDGAEHVEGDGAAVGSATATTGPGIARQRGRSRRRRRSGRRPAHREVERPSLAPASIARSVGTTAPRATSADAGQRDPAEPRDAVADGRCAASGGGFVGPQSAPTATSQPSASDTVMDSAAARSPDGSETTGTGSSRGRAADGLEPVGQLVVVRRRHAAPARPDHDLTREPRRLQSDLAGWLRRGRHRRRVLRDLPARLVGRRAVRAVVRRPGQDRQGALQPVENVLEVGDDLRAFGAAYGRHLVELVFGRVHKTLEGALPPDGVGLQQRQLLSGRAPDGGCKSSGLESVYDLVHVVGAPCAELPVHATSGGLASRRSRRLSWTRRSPPPVDLSGMPKPQTTGERRRDGIHARRCRRVQRPVRPCRARRSASPSRARRRRGSPPAGTPASRIQP